jgi:hypothetical protein
MLEALLQQQAEVLEKLFDHVPLLINITGSDGFIKYVNRCWGGITSVRTDFDLGPMTNIHLVRGDFLLEDILPVGSQPPVTNGAAIDDVQVAVNNACSYANLPCCNVISFHAYGHARLLGGPGKQESQVGEWPTHHHRGDEPRQNPRAAG